MPINHIYTSPQADVGSTELVQPSNWNSLHAYTLQDAVSLSGNTSGVLANISSGTLYLAGGNNVTLSQNANSITISAANETQTVAPIGTAVKGVSSIGSTGTITRFAPEDHQHSGLYQISVGGNTVGGNTTAGAGSFMLAGGNNITLSGATAVGGMSLTISAANETQTVPPIGTAVKGVSSVGSTGTVTRFAPEDHQHLGLHSINVGGNTVGATTAGAGSFMLAGGDNITLSGATAAGGMTLSISAGAAGAGVIATTVQSVATLNSVGTVTRYAPEDHRHEGLFKISVVGNTAGGNTTAGGGSLVLAGGPNITLSGATAAGGMTLSISAAAPGGGATDQAFVEVNGPFAVLAGGASFRANSFSHRPLFQPFLVEGGGISVKTMKFIMARSGGVSCVVTLGAGIYTMANSTSLALVSSTTNAFSFTASTQFSGTREWHITGLGALTLSAGRYWMGFHVSASTTATVVGDLVLLAQGAMPTVMLGQVLAGTDNTVASNVSALVVPFGGVYSATSGLLPANLGASDMWGGSGSAQNSPFYAMIRGI